MALSLEGSVIPELVGYQSALCDNGILDSGGFQTADIVTARQFGCYEVPRLKIPAPQPIVKLQDRFGTTTSKPVNFRQLCAPEDKNGEDPTSLFCGRSRALRVGKRIVKVGAGTIHAPMTGGAGCPCRLSPSTIGNEHEVAEAPRLG